MRYHSIVADTLAGIPDCLKITACTARSDGQGVNLDEPMALEHRTRSIYGVQFHPESFATPSGSIIARNFVSLCRSF
jgi:anthranilate synthase component 2